MILVYTYDTFENTKKIINEKSYPRNQHIVAVKDTSVSLESHLDEETNEIKLYLESGFDKNRNSIDVTGIHLTDEQDLMDLFRSFMIKNSFRESMKESKEEVTFANGSEEDTIRMLNGQDYPDNVILFGMNALGVLVYSTLKRGAKRLLMEVADGKSRMEQEITGTKFKDLNDLKEKMKSLVEDCKNKVLNQEPIKPINSFGSGQSSSKTDYTEPKISIADLAFIMHCTLEEAEDEYKNLIKRKTKLVNYSKENVKVFITKIFRQISLEALKKVKLFENCPSDTLVQLASAELSNIKLNLVILDGDLKIIENSTGLTLIESKEISLLNSKSDMLDFLKECVIKKLAKH